MSIEPRDAVEVDLHCLHRDQSETRSQKAGQRAGPIQHRPGYPARPPTRPASWRSARVGKSTSGPSYTSRSPRACACFG